MPLPNFLMIGAGRSGTTTVYHTLIQHPQVFLSPEVKESRFFCAESDPAVEEWFKLRRDIGPPPSLEGYRQLFAGATGYAAIGEVDPCILPNAVGTIPKIVDVLGPRIKLLVCLRQPADRAFSHHVLHSDMGLENQPFERVIQPDYWTSGPAGRLAQILYIEHGLYSENLKRFLDTFGREAVLVQLYQDLATDIRGYFRNILTWLEVDPDIPINLGRHNEAKIIKGPLGRVVHLYRRHKHRAKGFVPNALRVRVRELVKWNQIIASNRVKPTLAPETRRALTQYYREDILRTQDLIGRDLTAWL
jgi:hypothetical protein